MQNMHRIYKGCSENVGFISLDRRRMRWKMDDDGCSKNQDNALSLLSRSLFRKSFALDNPYRLLTDHHRVLAHTARRKPTTASDGIRKLPTARLATSSARKLRLSVRQEEIVWHNSGASERSGREYYYEQLAAIYYNAYFLDEIFSRGHYRGYLIFNRQRTV